MDTQQCSQCGDDMVVEEIDGHDSWVCDRDGTAWAVDQEWAMAALEEDA